jgi:glycosyltransferase involved in cell wall biosynthesis
MKRLPLVSIVIPTYNQVHLVDDAIRSAVTQDYERLEIVVSDDGSTDGTPDRIRRWMQEYPGRVIGLVDQPHLGITGNCNRAMSASTGEYVAFGAGDDMFLPGKISAQVAWFEADSNRVLCGHDVEVFESESNRRLYLWSERHRLRTGAGAAGVIAGASCVSSSIMVRRTSIPHYGFDDRFPVSSDTKLWVDCLAAGGQYGYVHGLYGRYRRHAGNLTNVDDRRKSEALFADMLSFYTIVAAEYPSLAAVCARRRAGVCWWIAGWYLRRGEKDSAKPYLRDALTRITRSSSVADRLIALVPGGSALRVLMMLRRNVRGAVVQLRGRYDRLRSSSRTS